MKAFIKNEKSKEMIARCLESTNVKTRTQIFFLLATVCTYSEEGFWLALDVVNLFKNLKREKVRFETLVKILEETPDDTEENIILKVL